MSRKCTITGKASMVGNRVSHAKNRTKVRLLPNIHKRRIFVPTLGKKGKFITVKVSAQTLRSISKNGIDAYCAELGLKAK